MFGKGAGSVETLVGRNCDLKGNVHSKGTIRVDGKVEGNVTSEDGVIVGEHAIVKGDIEGRHIIIGGKVTGDVFASSKLEILHTGSLYGDIRTPILVINEGVVFEGTCEMERAMQEQGKK